MKNYHVPLQPGCCYHLFSRAIGNEKLFLSPGNYSYFLNRLHQHILPIDDLFTYSLLPNHFHLLVSIKRLEEIIKHYEIVKMKTYSLTEINLPDFIMERFSNWLNGYTKAFNKMYNRKGALFIDFIKRSEVKKDSDFTSFLFYVHKNAVHHGITKKIGLWPHDAYNTLIDNAPTLLLRNEVLDWFGSIAQFIKFHQQPVALKSIDFLEC